MKDLVIFGASQLSDLADFYFTHDTPRTVTAFTLDAEYARGTEHRGRPMVPFEVIEARYPPDQFDMFVAIGYSKLNDLRREKVDAAKAKGYALASYVSSKATTFPDLTHGENCFILENNVIQPFVKIGDNVVLWSGNHIGHHAVIEDNAFLASHVVISGGVRIGKNSFVGVNATIRDQITVGARCVLGAGALVIEDLAPESVVAPRGDVVSPVPSNRLRKI
jgi:sugar O-acyltransferase (sialic acid O-acetyltransferase NeuD family)